MGGICLKSLDDLYNTQNNNDIGSIGSKKVYGQATKNASSGIQVLVTNIENTSTDRDYFESRSILLSNWKINRS